MWELGGHQVLITGEGRDEAQWGDHYVVRCLGCPDDPGADTPLWRAGEESPPALNYPVALEAVVEHVRPHADVSDDDLDAAIFMAALEGSMEVGSAAVVRTNAETVTVAAYLSAGRWLQPRAM